MQKSAIRFGLSVIAIASFYSVPLARAQGRHARKQAAIEESAKPKAVAGGVAFQRNAPYDKTFEDVVNFLKKQGYNIDSADKDAGNVFTTMSITGKWRQTGTRVTVTLIKDSAAATSVRVAVTEQKRYKAAQTEPWSEPKLNDDKTTEIAKLIKSGIS